LIHARHGAGLVRFFDGRMPIPVETRHFDAMEEAIDAETRLFPSREAKRKCISAGGEHRYVPIETILHGAGEFGEQTPIARDKNAGFAVEMQFSDRLGHRDEEYQIVTALPADAPRLAFMEFVDIASPDVGVLLENAELHADMALLTYR